MMMSESLVTTKNPSCISSNSNFVVAGNNNINNRTGECELANNNSDNNSRSSRIKLPSMYTSIEKLLASNTTSKYPEAIQTAAVEVQSNENAAAMSIAETNYSSQKNKNKGNYLIELNLIKIILILL